MKKYEKKYRQFKDFTFVLSQQIWQTSTTFVLIFCPSLGSDSVGQRDQHHTDRHTGVQWLVLPYRQRAPTDGTRRNPAGHLWLWKHNRRGTGTYIGLITICHVVLTVCRSRDWIKKLILWFTIHDLDNREWMCYTHSLTCFDA